MLKKLPPRVFAHLRPPIAEKQRTNTSEDVCNNIGWQEPEIEKFENSASIANLSFHEGPTVKIMKISTLDFALFSDGVVLWT